MNFESNTHVQEIVLTSDRKMYATLVVFIS